MPFLRFIWLRVSERSSELAASVPRPFKYQLSGNLAVLHIGNTSFSVLSFFVQIRNLSETVLLHRKHALSFFDISFSHSSQPIGNASSRCILEVYWTVLFFPSVCIISYYKQNVNRFCDNFIYIFLLTIYYGVSGVFTAEKSVSGVPFLYDTGGKLWHLRVKNVQRGTDWDIQFVETQQFAQKGLLFRKKNAIMSICICGSIHQYSSACLCSRFQALGKCRILYIIYL